MKKPIAVITAILILLSTVFVMPVSAAGSQMEIGSAKDLLALAEQCRLDSYSQDLTVILVNDIDLKNSGFESIPYFSGTFDGKGHTIKNVHLSKSGSDWGFIRRTAASAIIRNLTVSGSVASSGSARATGGLVGTNQGTIEACRFSGKVSGKEDTGGVAGVNTGMITDCENNADVTGAHRTGGIVGSNSGWVGQSVNKGRINHLVPASEQPMIKGGLSLKQFDVSQVSEDEFLDITDTGPGCGNEGLVGYDRTGYNTGGIAGRNIGRITSCTNSGSILGKKDVGGIVGQAQPYSQWDFSDSKLTEMQNTLDDISRKLETLKKDAAGSSDDIERQISRMEASVQAVSNDTRTAMEELSDNQARTKKSAGNIIAELQEAVSRHDHKRSKELLEQLRTLKDSGVIPLDELADILRQLREEEVSHLEEDHLKELEDLAGTIEEIIAGTELQQPDTDQVYQDILQVGEEAKALEKLMHSGSKTVQSDAKALRESLSGFSDAMQITAKDLSEVKLSALIDVSADSAYQQSVVETCQNTGSVAAETNAGGIAGTISFEIGFDAEDKLQVSDYLLNDAKYLVYSVIQDCESKNEVTAKKQNAGGILGNGDFGLIENCLASGTVRVTSGEYCGGIAGQTAGDIRQSASRSILYGSGYVGGIVGKGSYLFDCKAYTFLKSGDEFIGSVAGSLDKKAENCFFVENGVGGINGISYKGQAQALTFQEMMKKSDVPDLFRNIIVTFVAQDKTVAEIEVEYGGSIEKLPEVPKDGLDYWKWDDFDSEHIYYSQTVEGSYQHPKTTISTEGDIPQFLAEGTFYEEQILTCEPLRTSPEQEGKTLAAYTVSVSHFSGKLTLRMKAEAGGQLTVAGSPAAYEQDGSYLVFEAENGSEILYTKSEKRIDWIWIVVISLLAAALLAAVVTVIILKRRHTSTPQPDDSLPPTPAQES